MTAKQKKFIDELKTRIFTFDRHGHCENEVVVNFGTLRLHARSEKEGEYDIHVNSYLVLMNGKEGEIFSERSHRNAKFILDVMLRCDCPELLAFLSPLKEAPKEKGFAFEQLSLF